MTRAIMAAVPDRAESKAGCVFCGIAAGEVEAEVVLDDPRFVAFLDVRPVFPGHVLLVPRAHHRTLADLPVDLLGPMFERAQRLSAAVPAALGATGSFVAVNNIVSQSVPHLHVHVVPRSPKDGLRGFFWPRTAYDDDAHRGTVGESIRRELTRESAR
jgi:histidine triad (HIT) family protein